MADFKLVGSVNLARLENVGIVTIKGATSSKKGIVIPIEDNDIYVKVENKTDADGKQYVDRRYNLGIEVYERQNVSAYGHTHYIKPSVSKEFVSSNTEEKIKERNGIYLGDLKPITIPSSNQVATIEAPVADIVVGDDSDLPF